MTERSFADSFRPFDRASACIAWDDRGLLLQTVDDRDAFRLEGRLPSLLGHSPHDRYVALQAIRSIEVCQPWPAFDLAWAQGEVVHRMLVHPRGVARLVPASDEARVDFARFAQLVEQLVAHVAHARPDVPIDRGWLDDDDVTWMRRDVLPGARAQGTSYRDAAPGDVLLARAVVQRSFWRRARVAMRRRFGDIRDPMPIELALSEREIWIVDEAGRAWGVPRRSLRAIYTDDERIACIFGRSTFLAMSILPSPIRDALVDAAERVVAQNEAIRAARGE